MQIKSYKKTKTDLKPEKAQSFRSAGNHRNILGILLWRKNVRLVNCHLKGEQLLCYVDNLKLENCTFDAECDRIFEYSTVEADIRGHVENIKNPTSGHIVADSIGSITIDKNVRQPNNCVIETRKL